MFRSCSCIFFIIITVMRKGKLVTDQHMLLKMVFRYNDCKYWLCIYIYIPIYIFFSKYLNLQVNVKWVGSIELKLLTYLSLSTCLNICKIWSLDFFRRIALYTNCILRRSLGFVPEAKNTVTCHNFLVYKWEWFKVIRDVEIKEAMKPYIPLIFS